jgi:hypothetical protein
MKAAGASPIRRLLPALLFLAAPAAAASDIVVHRDPGCPCCEKWVDHVRRELGRPVKVIESADRPALMKRLGVPKEMASCHTAVVDGLVVEGHVPAADIKRALAMRGKKFRGLAVPGMPLGSPGMEAGGRTQPYAVIAFGAGKPRIFQKH